MRSLIDRIPGARSRDLLDLVGVPLWVCSPEQRRDDWRLSPSGEDWSLGSGEAGKAAEAPSRCWERKPDLSLTLKAGRPHAPASAIILFARQFNADAGWPPPVQRSGAFEALRFELDAEIQIEQSGAAAVRHVATLGLAAHTFPGPAR